MQLSLEIKKEFIPLTSGINDKDLNIFGSISNNLSEFTKISYDFIIDDDLNSLKYNSLKTSITYKNFNTTFNFIERNGIIGDTNTLENNTKIKFNNSNYFLLLLEETKR